MSWTISGLCTFLAASQFNVSVIPLPTESADVFLIPGDSHAVADVCVLHGNNLQAHSMTKGAVPWSLTLPEGTSAFDILHDDGTGGRTLLAVCGERILSYNVPPAGPDAAPRELFRLQTRLAEPDFGPYPHVLWVNRGERCLLALPRGEALELRTMEGQQVETFPMRPETYDDGSVHRAFRAYPTGRNWIGSRAAFEFRINTEIVLEAVLPEDLAPPPAKIEDSRVWRVARWRLSETDPSTWPSFPLRTKGEAAARVFFIETGGQGTRLRLGEPEASTTESDEPNWKIGPERRYPGTILVGEMEDLPDFNGDGYVDLLMWKVEEPGVSVEALTRAVMGGSWPIRFTVHLFDPKEKRYEPRPSTGWECRVPILWFLDPDSEMLSRTLILPDLDDDGRTDFAAGTNPKEFSVWLYRDGFSDKPDHTARFPEEIERLEFCTPVQEGKPPAIGLRGKSAVYVLRFAE